MGVKEIKTKEELEELLKGEKLVVIDFFATWCGPCKQIGPHIEGFSAEYTDVIFVKIDVDELAEVAEECNVTAMPTFQFYKVDDEGKKQKVDEVVGANKNKIEELIKKYK